MPDNTTSRVIGVIARTQHMDPATILPESTFEELGLDSLDGINIAFALENEFNVDIPDDALPKLRSIKDIVSGVESLVAARAGA